MPRLMTDGNGNLLIDEPGHEDHGKLVKYHEGSFVFIGPQDLSHNQTHEQNVATVTGTIDQDMVNQSAEEAGLDPSNFANMVNVDQDQSINLHHYEVQPDDDHFNSIKVLPDSVAPTVTGHTDAWKEN